MASDIRAGRAFVELVMKDEAVRASLDNFKTHFKAFGQTVTTVGGGSFVAMSTTANGAIASTTASVGVLAASLAVLRSSVALVGTVFSTAFRVATSSILSVVTLLGTASLLAARFSPAAKRMLDGFPSKSQSIEVTGRWVRLIGGLTGHPALKQFGDRIEKLGLGASIARGFQAGLLPGISATFGAVFRRTQSVVKGWAASLVGSVVSGAFRTVTGLGRAGAGAAPGLLSVAAGGNAAATSLGRIGVAGQVAAGGFGAARAAAMALATTLLSLTLRVGAVAAAVAGPAILAARKFVTSAQEMKKTADETGKSLDTVIRDKYGNFSFIEPKDVEQAAALGTVMDDLKKQMAAAWAQVGIAALPVLRRMTEFSLAAAQAVTRFLKDNQELVGTVISVAARVASGAAAVLLFAKGVAIAIPIVMALVSPLGLVAAGVAGILYFFPQVREAAMNAFGFVYAKVSSLGEIFGETLGGIMDALTGGSLQAAATVLWTGLRLAWLTGTAELRELWGGMVDYLWSVGRTIFTNFRAGWAITMKAIGDGWQMVVDGIFLAWRTVYGAIEGAFARVIAYMTGQDVNEVLASLTEMQNRDAKASQTASAARMKARQDEFNQAIANISAEHVTGAAADKEAQEARRAAAKKDLEDAQKAFEQSRANAARLKAEALAAGQRGADEVKDEKKPTDGAFRTSAASDLRSREGLQSILVAFSGRTTEAQIAENTAKTARETEKGGRVLERIERNIGNGQPTVPANLEE